MTWPEWSLESFLCKKNDRFVGLPQNMINFRRWIRMLPEWWEKLVSTFSTVDHILSNMHEILYFVAFIFNLFSEKSPRKKNTNANHEKAFFKSKMFLSTFQRLASWTTSRYLRVHPFKAIMRTLRNNLVLDPILKTIFKSRLHQRGHPFNCTRSQIFTTVYT